MARAELVAVVPAAVVPAARWQVRVARWQVPVVRPGAVQVELLAVLAVQPQVPVELPRAVSAQAAPQVQLQPRACPVLAAR